MNVKKYLLPKDGNFYKANLHSHTTVSDGRFTPAEAKKIYLEKGYSIVAFSDKQPDSKTITSFCLGLCFSFLGCCCTH